MMFPNPAMGGPAAIMPAPGMMTGMNMGGAMNMAPVNQGMNPMGGGMPPMGGGMNPMGGGFGQM